LKDTTPQLTPTFLNDFNRMKNQMLDMCAMLKEQAIK